MMHIKENLKTTIHRYKLICSGDRVLVAVSGGPDSVALLHLLYELRQEFDLHLEVAHLEHGIRGEESKEDARFVGGLAEQLYIPFHLKQVNLSRDRGNAGKGNLEGLARRERYRFFADMVTESELDKVAVAHTQDDQAETVLMRLLRGSGMKGLGGMSPLHHHRIAAGNSADALTVIRPLLEVSKAEILEYLKDRNLEYRIDRSNWDTALSRNWIRLELLPKIQQQAGIGFLARLSHTAEILRGDDSLMEEIAAKRYESLQDSNRLSRGGLLSESTALQRRILRRWIGQTRGHLRGLDFVHIETLLRLIREGPPQGRLSIPGGWELVREYETLNLKKRSGRPRRICYTYAFSVGTVLRIPEAGVELCSRQVDSPPTSIAADLMEALLDLEALPKHLVVRNFRRGDRFQPLGMAGHKKIKDLFIDQKVSLSVRATQPLLAANDEILWIPGYGRSEIARVTEKTTSVLHIKAVLMAT